VLVKARFRSFVLIAISLASWFTIESCAERSVEVIPNDEQAVRNLIGTYDMYAMIIDPAFGQIRLTHPNTKIVADPKDERAVYALPENSDLDSVELYVFKPKWTDQALI